MEPENNKATDNKALIIDAELAELVDAISKALDKAQQVANIIGKGKGWHEVDLSTTNLQQAQRCAMNAQVMQKWQ